MTVITPPTQMPRVRPLWQRDQLFREPEYTDGAKWNDQDSDETNDVDPSDS